jgi:superfamily II DNA or RNA helicase
MSWADFSNLEDLRDVEHVLDEPVLDLIERLAPLEPDAASVLAVAAATLFQVPQSAKPAMREKVLRSLSLGHLVKLWRFRRPSVPTTIRDALPAAIALWVPILEARIRERMPSALECGAVGDMWVGLFRRRLVRSEPTLYRELGMDLAVAPDSLRVADWLMRPPPLGPSKDGRAKLERFFSRLLGDDRPDLAAARSAHYASLANDPRLAPALEALRAMSAARPLRDPIWRGLSVSISDTARAFSVTSDALDACNRDLCTTAMCSLGNPRLPTVGCRAGHTPDCSLQRGALDLLNAALTDTEAPLSPQLRAEIKALYLTEPTDILLARLAQVTREGTPEPTRIGWLLSPFERLELVELTEKKKGGLKTRRLSRVEAEDAIVDPGHATAMTLLASQRLFQERRPHHDAIDQFAPVLAALAGRSDTYYLREGEVQSLTIRAAEVKLAPSQAATHLSFGVRLGDRFFPEIPKDRDWLVALDVATDTLTVGLLSPRLRATLERLTTEELEVSPARQEQVAEAILKLQKQVPLALSSSWLGTRHDLAHQWVLQLESLGGRTDRSLRARLGVKVLPELSALMPGEGEPILPVRRPGPDGEPHLGHIERQFALELAEAQELWDALGLPPDREGSLLSDLDRALDVVARAQELAAHHRLEVTWASKPLRVARSPKPDRLRVQLGVRRDWLDLQGGFRLDGSELPLRELLAALRDHKRFVSVDDETVLELDEALRQTLTPLTALAREQSGKLVASPLAAPLVEDLAAAGVDVITPPDWLDLTGRMREASSLEPPSPSVEATMRPYQREGYTWIMRLAHWARGACLADDMGLGKTLQALAVVSARAALGPTLVIAPTSVVPNWVREARRFTPHLRVERVLQGAALDAALAELGPNALLVTSWDLLVRHEARIIAPPLGDGARWATAILDEAQALKNPQTRRAQSARRIEADFILALTGTPVENRPVELWSLFSVVAPGLLGSAESFRDNFALRIESRDPDAPRELSRLIRPFLLRRTKTQVATDLPPKTEVRVDVLLSDDERTRYQKVRLAAAKELESLGTDALSGQTSLIRILAVLTRLRQLACHPRLVDPHAPLASSKLIRLLELAEELRGEQRKMLIFSQFTELLTLVRDRFDEAGLTYTYLDGSTPGLERERAVERFQSGAVDAFLLSLKAGGVGLNLTTATEVIHLDPWWNPAVEDQASDRAHRIGQDRPVTIYRMVSNGTIEEQILSLHGDKRQMVSSLLEGTASASPFSADEMLALLLSGPGAPEDRPETDEVIDVTPERSSATPSDEAPGRRSRSEIGRHTRETSKIKSLESPTNPTAGATPAPAPGETELLERAIALLETHVVGLSKRALVTALDLDDRDWMKLRMALGNDPRVITEGTTRAMTYRLASV